MCTRRGDIQPAQGEHRGGIKTANKPPWPAGVQRFNGMKRTPRVVIPPHAEVPKKCEMEVFITAPNRAPAETQRSGFGGKRTSDRESESCRLRRDEGFVVRSDDGQHRICLVCGEAAALPNALGGAWPHTPFSGRSPHPLKAASVSAETLLPASGGAASKGDQSPFEEPPALRGDERNHFRKVTDYEKRYQIQHAHGVR